MTRPFVRGITIDPPGSRDLDDAIWVEKTHDGFVAHITVPDATAYIPIGGKVDQEARQRLVTVYHKRGVDHMLPKELSEGRLSLLPGEERKTLTVSVVLGSDLRVEGLPELRLTKLRSEARLAYTDVPKIINDRDHALHGQLVQGTIIANALASNRKNTGSVGLLDLPGGWVTTEEGIPRKVLTDHHAGHVLIRELMVIANASVANLSVEEGFPMEYRNHPNGRLIDLTHWLKPNEELPDLHDINAIREFFGTSKARARYGTVSTGHDGLNLPAYTRMTSPIRRFVDLVVHRQLKAYLLGHEYPYTRAQLVGLANSLNRRAVEFGEEKPKMHRMWSPSGKIPDDFVTHLYNYAEVARIRPPRFTVEELESMDEESRYVCICHFNGVKRTASAPTEGEAKQATAKAIFNKLGL